MTAGGSPPVRDTIVAIATPQGAGAIGVVRLSGPRAAAIAGDILRPSRGRKFTEIPPRRLERVTVVDPRAEAPLDEALAAWMPGPSSYTAEDTVEISCHGNSVLLGLVVELLTVSGARLAEPGEFTRRAYLNGRVSLLEAEAVAEMIAARSETALRLAARELRKGIEEKLALIRDALLDLVAGLEVSLDFPDDGLGTSDEDAAKRMREAAGAVASLLRGARKGRAMQDGLVVMLAGAPNVGKSSLLNAIVGSERAIVSPLPGTTRDVVESQLMVRGTAITIRDGAGLGMPRDEIDAEAMRRTRSAIGRSDLVLVVLDRSRPREAQDDEVLAATNEADRVIVANKSDLPSAWAAGDSFDCECSAVTGAGVAELMGRMEQWVEQRIGRDGEEGGIVASLRVVEDLDAAGEALERAARAIGRVPVEAVLVDLRGGLRTLDSILGVDGDEAVLDRVFSKFCVGK